jgi:hypothetical protein
MQIIFVRCLVASIVHVWRQKAGWKFTNPDQELVAWP